MENLTIQNTNTLEGIGSIAACLKTALVKVEDEIDSREQKKQSLSSNEIGAILDSFEQAILESSSRVDEEAKKTATDLHATIFGSAKSYNRVGQNWRLIGDKGCILRQGHTKPDCQTVPANFELSDDNEAMTFSSESCQLLAYGDR